jgi:hypothetical protein
MARRSRSDWTREFEDHWSKTRPYRVAEDVPLLDVAKHFRNRLIYSFIVLRLVKEYVARGFMTSVARVEPVEADREPLERYLATGGDYERAHALPCNPDFLDWKSQSAKKLYDYVPGGSSGFYGSKVKADVFNYMDLVHRLVNDADQSCERLSASGGAKLHMPSVLAQACLEVGQNSAGPMEAFRDIIVPGYHTAADLAYGEAWADMSPEEHRIAERGVMVDFFPAAPMKLPKSNLFLGPKNDPRARAAAKKIRLDVLDEYRRAPEPSNAELEDAASDYLPPPEARRPA